MFLEQEKKYRLLLKNSYIKNIFMFFYISGLAQHCLIIEKPLKTKSSCSRSFHACVILVSLDPFQNSRQKKPTNNRSKFIEQEAILFSLCCFQSLFVYLTPTCSPLKDSVFNSIFCTAICPLQIRPREGTGTRTSLTLPFSKNARRNSRYRYYPHSS